MRQPGDLIEVVLTKYGGSLHRRSTMTWLGEDEHGDWLWSPAGTQLIGPGGTVKWTVPDPTVRLIPRDDWWTGIFYADVTAYDVYCDITTPADWRHTGKVVLMDLDLDLLRHRDGRVEFLDEDEFDVNATQTPYPPDLINAARSCWRGLGDRLIERDEPFETRFRTWFKRAGER